MNIFVLDLDIEKCAQYHCDKHVVKMILESAQMLCTVLHQNKGTAPYKPCHMKHPCTIWARESLANWLWLYELALALDREYRYRYNSHKSHNSATVIQNLTPPSIPNIGMTPFAQAMPDIYKTTDNPVQAYRNYYMGEKAAFCTWKNRPIPPWFTHLNVEQS